MNAKQVYGAIVAFAICAPAAALAASDADLAEIRQQIDSLQQRRTEDARRIEDLERRLREAEETARRAVEQAEEAAARTAPATVASAPAAAPNALNPAISIVLDGKLGSFEEDPETYSLAGFAIDAEGPGQRGLFLGEAEINASANIDDLFFGNLTLAVEQDDDETEVELEEAYIQTLGRPYGLQATAGKFFSGIGYLNSFHRHADDFADRPLAYRAFLADQFGDAGLRASWIAPTDLFLELGAEVFRGTSFPAEGAEDDGLGARAAFLKVGGDFSTEVSWQAGLSWLSAEAGNRETGELPDAFAGTSDVAIAHAVMRWAPDGNPTQRNLKLQAELFRNRSDGTFNGIDVDRVDYGAYGQAVYQFMPRWRTGYRFDWLQAGDIDAALAGSTLDDQGHDPTRHSVMLEYDHSEFSRIRLQYNYDLSRPDEEDHQLLLQYTATLGAHPAHQY